MKVLSAAVRLSFKIDDEVERSYTRLAGVAAYHTLVSHLKTMAAPLSVTKSVIGVLGAVTQIL